MIVVLSHFYINSTIQSIMYVVKRKTYIRWW